MSARGLPASRGGGQGRSSRIAPVVLLSLAVGAAAAWAVGAPTWLANVLADVGLATLLVSAIRSPAVPRFRAPRWIGLAIAATALEGASATFRVPYLSDDWHLLGMLHAAPSPWTFLAGIPETGYWRPLPWLLWWVYAQVSPVDATFARLVAAALFAANACLAAPALRKLGVPRGTAAAAALLFAASPMAIDTASWMVNHYSLLSVGFGLAALALVPVRRPGLVRAIPSAACAALALLAKEDAVLWVVLCCFAGLRAPRMQRRRMLRVSALLVAGVLGVTAIRFLSFGHLDYYRAAIATPWERLGESMRGLLRSAATESHGALWFPVFDGGGAAIARGIGALALLPPVLLAAAGFGRPHARSIGCGTLIALLALVPVAHWLPVTGGLAHARLAYVAALGLSLVLASLLVALPVGPTFRWLALATLAGSGVAVGWWNARDWIRAGEAFEARSAALAPLVEAAPSGARVLVHGQPDSVGHALCFRNATSFFLSLTAGRPDVFAVDGIGALVTPKLPQEYDRVLLFEDATGAAHDLSSLETDLRLEHGGTLVLPVPVDGPGGSRSYVSDAGPGGATSLVSVGSSVGSVVLPAVRVPRGSRVSIDVDEGLRSGALRGQPPVVATWRSGARLARRFLADGPSIDLPNDADVVRFELLVPIGTTLVLRRLTLSASAR